MSSTSSMVPAYEEAHAPALAGLPLDWGKGRSTRLAIISFLIGLVGVGVTFLADRHTAFASYLTAFMLFLSLALGALFFVVIHHLTGSRWGVTVRRLAESTMGTLPLFALLFLPIALFGMHDLFEWTHAEVVAKDALLQKKAIYLNEPFFYARAVLYFVVWSAISSYLLRASRAQDRGDGVALLAKMKWMSAPALLVAALTSTFAAFDWLMSLSPHWFSTIFGVYYFSGGFQGVLALLVLIAVFLQRGGLLGRAVTVEHYHDLGKLLFGFTIFYAYIAFSQYFLIWYANIPEETEWFLARWGPWSNVSLALVFLTFVIPFFTLIARGAKRVLPILVTGAIVVLIGRAVDMYWLVMPSLDHHHAGPHFSFANVTAIIGIGGLFLGALCLRLGGSKLVPVGDPLLLSSLGHENA